MQGYSLAHWPWFRLPGAIIKNGLIVPGENKKLLQPINRLRSLVFPLENGEKYYPGEDITQLLNALQKVEDEDNALEFVRKWGLLGLRCGNIKEALRQEQKILGAVEFALAAQEKRGEEIDDDLIDKEVSRLFYPEGEGKGVNLMPEGDSLAETLSFVQWVKYISEVKRLIRLYEEDPCAANYDAEEWFSNYLSGGWKAPDGTRLHILKMQYEGRYASNCNKPDFYEYALKYFLDKGRSSYFGLGTYGVYVTLSKEGFPIFQFDGLFRLIAYALLSFGAVSPKKCLECGALFFPTKTDQEHCPPLPGKKRSRCEMRHSKREERKLEKEAVKLYKEGYSADQIVNNLKWKKPERKAENIKRVQNWISIEKGNK